MTEVKPSQATTALTGAVHSSTVASLCVVEQVAGLERIWPRVFHWRSVWQASYRSWEQPRSCCRKSAHECLMGGLNVAARPVSRHEVCNWSRLLVGAANPGHQQPSGTKQTSRRCVQTTTLGSCSLCPCGFENSPVEVLYLAWRQGNCSLLNIWVRGTETAPSWG